MLREKKFYLTEKGLARIKKEYERLKKIKFAKTKGEFPRVLHSEDVNPEYLFFYEDLDLLETKLAELDNILRNDILITPPPKGKRNIVNLGARVVVEADGQIDEFEIVGPLEANPSIGRISSESPVGSAILGHKVGDEIIISSPIKVIYKIKKIKYPSIMKEGIETDV